MRRIHPDVVVGGVLLVFCVVVYLIIPIEIQELMRYDASMGLSPAVFPKISVFLIAGFSAVLIFFGLRPKDVAQDRQALGIGSRARVITAFIIILVYVYLIGILGYLVITPLALIILMWYFGERRWLLILSVAILTTTGLFCFFRYIMYIILPEGKFLS
jgi:hypothetical protein